LLLSFVAFLSFILRRPIFIHNLHVEKVTSFGIHGVHYVGVLNDDVHFDFACARISLKFHFPTTPNPRWLTIEVDDVLYKSGTCDILLASLLVTCWFFPRLFRQTAGPWANVEIHDFRIRIMSSDAIPSYIQMLRANLVEAVLAGEIPRVDDCSTSVRFTGLSEKDEGARTKAFLSKEQDEMRINVSVEGLHVNNRQGRFYSFASIDAQLRRNWSANRGSFVMIATEGRWVKIPWEYEMVAPTSWPLQVFTGIAHFPYDIFRCFKHPMVMVNLYVPRVDVTFDNFRLRDAELVLQCTSLLRQSMIKADLQWSDVFVDALATA
ncbi:hypothetical protein BC835DRAFT_1221759, partial [Cytidiella melzeri]